MPRLAVTGESTFVRPEDTSDHKVGAALSGVMLTLAAPIRSVPGVVMAVSQARTPSLQPPTSPVIPSNSPAPVRTEAFTNSLRSYFVELKSLH